MGKSFSDWNEVKKPAVVPTIMRGWMLKKSKWFCVMKKIITIIAMQLVIQKAKREKKKPLSKIKLKKRLK